MRLHRTFVRLAAVQWRVRAERADESSREDGDGEERKGEHELGEHVKGEGADPSEDCGGV